MAPMAVPKATIYENYRFVLRQHNIRAAGQVLTVQAKAIPQRMQSLSDQDLGLGVLAPDAGHHLTAFRLRDNVSHSFRQSVACLRSPWALLPAQAPASGKVQHVSRGLQRPAQQPNFRIAGKLVCQRPG